MHQYCLNSLHMQILLFTCLKIHPYSVSTWKVGAVSKDLPAFTGAQESRKHYYNADLIFV